MSSAALIVAALEGSTASERRLAGPIIIPTRAPTTAELYGAVALGAAYALLCMVGVFLLLRVHYYTKSWTKQKIMLLLVAVCAAVRSSFWICAAIYPSGLWFAEGKTISGLNNGLNGSGLPPWAYVLNNLPGVLYLSIVSVLLLQWASVYYTATDNPGPYRVCFLPALAAVNATIWLLQIAMWVVYAAMPNSDDFDPNYVGIISTGSLAFVYLCLGIVVSSYGCRTSSILRDVPIEFGVIRRKVNEVRRLTYVCAICFSLRALLIVWGNIETFMPVMDIRSEALSLLLVASYYLLLEIVPCCVLLFYFRKLPPRPPAFAREFNFFVPAPQEEPILSANRSGELSTSHVRP